MPDQERDDPAFAAWWARFAETYPLATVEPKIHAAALLAWDAALATVQAERAAAGVLGVAADALSDALYSAGVLLPGGRPLLHALEEAIVAYETARARAEKEES